MRIWGLIICTLIALASWTIAADEPSSTRGKELFSSPGLGSNKKSCASCHPGGKGLDGVSTYSEQHLAQIVNGCIEKMLRGKPLPPHSTEMRSLLLYISSLGSPGR